MNRVSLLGVDRPHLVHRLADHVEHAAQRFRAHRHFHGTPQAGRPHPAHQALGGLERDGPHAAFADVLLYFADNIDRRGDVEALADDLESARQVATVELAEIVGRDPEIRRRAEPEQGRAPVGPNDFP